MSFVYVIFEDGTDIYWARSRVLEYLQGIRGQLPDGVNPALGPGRDRRRLGLRVRAGRRDRPAQPRGAAQLPGLVPPLLAGERARRRRGREHRRVRQAVPGQRRSEQARGLRRRHQATSSRRSRRATTTSRAGCSSSRAASTWCAAAATSRRSTTSSRCPLGASARGTPVRVRDVAQVALGPDIRRGVAELDGKGEVVGGIVVMRYGENALERDRRA